jgi:hypothetical protein
MVVEDELKGLPGKNGIKLVLVSNEAQFLVE